MSRILAWTCLLLCCASEPVSAQLELGSVFGDNMVLQRNAPLVFYGFGEAGAEVTVTLRDQAETAKVDAEGHWQVRLDPISEGEPFEVGVVSGDQRIRLSNVVAGEVWICSGQSNMEWPVRASQNAEEEIAAANFPMIRHLDIQNRFSPLEQERANTSGWKICSPETAGNFSAVGFYFARKLHTDLNVPVGMVDATWGGTVAEAWTSGESLLTHPDFRDRVSGIRANAQALEDNLKKYQAEIGVWQAALNKAIGGTPEPWEAVELETAEWKPIKVNGNWESQGYADVDGVGWYRLQAELPADWEGKPVTLGLGRADDVDTTFVNGAKVGESRGAGQPRKYAVPGSLTKSGDVTIAVRVADTGGAGGLFGSPEQFYLECEGTRQPLARDWLFRLNPATVELPKRPDTPDFAGPNHPTALYNAMVRPILPVTFRGVIWYQGESNAGRAAQYRTLFPLLIQDWRQRHAELRGEETPAEFPFYWVQLANFMAPSTEPGPSNWADLREAQSMALGLPNTGEAVIIDIGEARDIHPRNKQDVGRRLALHALAKQYDQAVEFSGPRFRELIIEGNRARLKFDHAEGLEAKGGPLQRFEIAGKDGKFVWAEAVIDGQDVVVSAAEVAAPVAVRYAWADNPEGCNLYNGAGLPASPFRTDGE